MWKLIRYKEWESLEDKEREYIRELMRELEAREELSINELGETLAKVYRRGKDGL